MHQAGGEQVRGAQRLVGAVLADAALLAAGQGQDRDAMALGRMAQQDPADPDLDVVGMGADREDDLLALGPAVAGDRDQPVRLLEQGAGVDRLGQVVVGAGAQRGDRVVEAAVAGQHQRRHERLRGLQRADELEPVHAREVDVADHDVPVAGRRDRERLLRGRRPVDRAQPAQQLDEERGHDLVVLHDEELCVGGRHQGMITHTGAPMRGGVAI